MLERELMRFWVGACTRLHNCPCPTPLGFLWKENGKNSVRISSGKCGVFSVPGKGGRAGDIRDPGRTPYAFFSGQTRSGCGPDCSSSRSCRVNAPVYPPRGRRTNRRETACVPARPPATGTVAPTFPPQAAGPPPCPSPHLPELVRYWYSTTLEEVPRSGTA